MKYTAVLGRIFFAIAVIGSGLMQLIRQEFVRLVPKPPAWAGNPSLWAVLSGGILVAIGTGLIFDRKRHVAAITLAVLLGLTFLIYLPDLIANPGPGYMWTNPCKTLALLGGAILFTTSGNEVSRGGQPGDGAKAGWAWRVSAVLYGVFFVVGGIQHFVYLDFVAQLVPAWIPQRKVWACFAGIALMAGGLGINFSPTRRLAASLSGVMVFLWVILLHIPRAIAMPAEPGETAAIFEALALSGVAFLLVDTHRKV